MRQEADAVIVHHGYFWKNESPIIRGMKRNRLKTLLANDINLYGYHLPLDAHPELGNNVQLAQLLGITVMGEIEPGAVGRTVDASSGFGAGLVDRSAHGASSAVVRRHRAGYREARGMVHRRRPWLY